MSISRFPHPEAKTPVLKKFQRWLFQLPWTWRITLVYLTVMLFVPIVAMLTKASTEGPIDFWRIATSPIALATYDVTFTTSLIAALINGVFGTLIAWVLNRYNFPLKRLVDASVDLPFALPTAVAGLRRFP